MQPGEEQSLEYQLSFPKQIPPHEFILQMNLFYSVDNNLVAPRMFLNQVRQRGRGQSGRLACPKLRSCCQPGLRP